MYIGISTHLMDRKNEHSMGFYIRMVKDMYTEPLYQCHGLDASRGMLLGV